MHRPTNLILHVFTCRFDKDLTDSVGYHYFFNPCYKFKMTDACPDNFVSKQDAALMLHLL